MSEPTLASRLFEDLAQIKAELQPLVHSDHTPERVVVAHGIAERAVRRYMEASRA